MNTLTKSQLGIHVPVLGWLLIGANVVFLLVGAFVAVLLFGVGAAIDDKIANDVLMIVASSVGGLLTLLGIPGIVAGAGLLARKPWGRILSIVVSGISLLCFPLGTVLGVYGLVVLLQDAAEEYFGPCC